MLEKHLGHLKKNPTQPEGMPQPPLSQIAAKNSMSMKAEDSPATSPATVSNWTSPANTLGMSPANSEAAEYVGPIPGHPPGGPYQIQPGMAPPGMPPQAAFATSPTGHMGAPRQLPPGVGPHPSHRRQISDISGGPGDLGPDSKRQAMYGPGLPQIPPHMAPVVPMGQPLQNPLNPLQRRSG